MRGFRDDARVAPSWLWADETTVDGVSYRESMASGPEREALFAELEGTLRTRAAGLERAAEELRDLVGRFEPVEFVSSIAIPTSMGFVAKDDLFDDGDETHTWAAKIEYLLGLALSVDAGAASTPSEVTRKAMELLADVFDAAHARHMVDAFDRPLSGNDSLDSAVFLLGQEHLTDRMPGYAVHIERIDAEVFDRHRDYYVGVLGFNPADVTRVVRRRAAATRGRFEAAREAFAPDVGRHDPRRIAAVGQVVAAMTDSRTWPARSIAADARIELDEVTAMLRLFSTQFGSQPDFRLPTDPNLARTRPCVDISDDERGDVFFVPDPWALCAAVHPRLVEVLDAGARQRYQLHREKGHERIVETAICRVFGTNALGNRHYDNSAGDHGEIDVLTVGEWPLVVEAKSQSLTASGRRGAPRRVARVADDAIGAAIAQTTRARDYVMAERGRSFSATEGGPPSVCLPDSVVGLDEIVVTFERMDPLALESAGLVGEERRRPWALCAADLLMLTDVLVDPASFHHYARTRRSALEHGVRIYVESDALGGYLIDRLSSQIAAAMANPGTAVTLGYTSWAVNDYFTRLEVGLDAAVPTTGVPGDVRAALADVLGGDTGGAWVAAADAVMSAHRDTWRRWRRFQRRHRSAGSSFQLTERVRLVVGQARLERCAYGVVLLHVPAPDRGPRPPRLS